MLKGLPGVKSSKFMIRQIPLYWIFWHQNGNLHKFLKGIEEWSVTKKKPQCKQTQTLFLPPALGIFFFFANWISDILDIRQNLLFLINDLLVHTEIQCPCGFKASVHLWWKKKNMWCLYKCCIKNLLNHWCHPRNDLWWY